VNGVYNAVARNIVETGTGHGLLIKSDRTRGSHTTGDYNILVQNMTLTGVRHPLVISAYDPTLHGRVEPPNDPPQAVTALTPNIHDISVSGFPGLTATGTTGASFIVGLPEACIRNVSLNNVSIATSSTGLQLRNMTGTLANVTSMPGRGPAFVVQENVHVTTAGTTPAITDTPPETMTTPPEVPCGSNPLN
jgi:polygalacturonase